MKRALLLILWAVSAMLLLAERGYGQEEWAIFFLGCFLGGTLLVILTVAPKSVERRATPPAS